tara:strand:+ start:164 stop:685 length:522 start_codon:yes stop_codon:yes gene_type:complete
MNKIFKLPFIILLFFNSISGFGQKTPLWSYKNNNQPAIISYNLLDSIFETAKSFLKTKYVYGGCSEKGFDCSGLIYYVFQKHNILLSRSADALSKIGSKIIFEDIKEGDLLFFKSRDMNSNRIGHVSLVIGKTENSFQMIHSTNRGVVIDVYNEIKYYQDRFLFAKRFLKTNG